MPESESPSVWPVPRNEWTDIPVPELGGWNPTMRLSVVLPYYERSRALNRTLAGLAQQTYPMHLVQVIVADDGSPTDRPNPPASLPFDLQIETQAHQGFGAPRARNLGAKVAEGDILIFLDCDMIPERQHLEAHARWHHAASRLVTVGFRFHAEFENLSPEQVSAAVRESRLADLISDGVIERPEWIERHLERTDHLTGAYEDMYRVMSSGNLGFDRDLFWEAGGFDESFNRWGGEDNELGYRAIQLGAVVVPERSAIAWHQGAGHEPSPEEAHSLWLQRATMRQLITDPSFRAPLPGRSYTIPYLTVHVAPDGKDAESVGLTVSAILASEFTDLMVGIGSVDEADDGVWLADTFSPDPRVHLDHSAADLEERYPFTAARLTLPAGFGVDADSIGRLISELGGSGVGAVHITLPGQSPYDRMAELRLTRAVNRANSLQPGDVDASIGQLFGERWVSGAASGFWVIEDVEEARVRIRERRRTLAMSGLERDLAYAVAQLDLTTKDLDQLRARRVLRLVDGLGALLRSRSWTDLRQAFTAIGHSLKRVGTEEEHDPA